MRFVLDASVTLAWCFEDTASSVADAALAALEDGGEAIVPAIWRLELANVLVMAERRKRISEADTVRFLSLVANLPIRVGADLGSIESIVSLARSHGLTAYDAAYLDLAQRSGLPVATLDRRLHDAAKAAGVVVIDVDGH